ncbi:calcium-binding protein [Bradyrhizobium sp. sBnM-33]|uniref:calcium-binding protein n=1 Tax=Bradyrhizobium sp. sBnM-33 TaxID=2831780 RepID=UPI001BCFE7C7|nr:hypothetical protein [Bradyrhizobium sp. sBnM-33]WOH48860.1 hypothetical protein RX328_32935 [Bradyrhizobium sp. sBnM-33]
MPTFLRQAFPIALQGSVGTTLSLSSLVTQAFGDNAGSITGAWLGYYGIEAMQAWNFSYVNPASPSISAWRLNGSPIPASTPSSFNQTFVSSAQFATTDVQLGNMFDPQLYMTVRIDNGAPDPVYIQYVFTTDTAISSPVPVNRAPTATEIVAAARTFVAEHPGILNSNDCHWISMVIGGSVGATMSDASYSLVPTENLEGGFWRVAYRGTAATPSNWLTLTKPGDIVRFDWADPAQPQHTTLITGQVQPDGGVLVVDNSGTIHEHVAYYDQFSTASTVTIYRVTADNLYLIETTDASETVLGTTFNDLLRAGGGNDIINAGVGNDVVVAAAGDDTVNGGAGHDRIDGGSGVDTMSGNAGNDTYVINSASDIVVEQVNEGTDTLEVGFTWSGRPANVEVVQLTGSASINLTGTTGNDILHGNSATNTILGGVGADVIAGGGGKDLMTGGAGLDRMVLSTLSDSGTAFAWRDVINTFAHGDKIDFSALDANSTVTGNQGFSFVSAFTGVAGQLQWDLTNISPTGVKGYLVQGDINGDAAADFSLQIYTAPTNNLPGGSAGWNLAAWDFIL